MRLHFLFAAAFGLGLALSACGPSEQSQAPEPVPTPVTEAAPPPAQPDGPTGALAPTTGPTPEQLAANPATDPARIPMPEFVGLWAVSQAQCADPAWRFEAREVSTQGEVHCDFNSVAETGHGYAVQATCTAEGPPTPTQLNLLMRSRPRSMVIMGGPWERAELVFCAPLDGR